MTKVQSEPVAFRILQTPEGQIQTRVEQLKKRLAEGERPADIIPLLGVTGSTAAIPLLIEFLQSPDDSVQAPAAEALQIADTRAVGKAVMQSLKEHGPGRAWST